MNLLNELAIGKTIEFEDGIQRTIVEKLPHQDIKNAYYYKFDDGLIERDVRIHGRIVSNQVQAVVVPNEEIGGGHLTDKEFETLSVRITPAFYDIDLDGATNCKGDILRKLRIIINDIIDSRKHYKDV